MVKIAIATLLLLHWAATSHAQSSGIRRNNEEETNVKRSLLFSNSKCFGRLSGKICKKNLGEQEDIVMCLSDPFFFANSSAYRKPYAEPAMGSLLLVEPQ